MIISWSSHDYRQLLSVLTPGNKELLEAHYRNAIQTAKCWKELKAPEMKGDNSLYRYMSEIWGYEPSEQVGQNTVGKNLRYLRGVLKGGQTYPNMTTPQRTRWRNVIEHNRIDLWGMERVVKQCSRTIWRWLGYPLI